MSALGTLTALAALGAGAYVLYDMFAKPAAESARLWLRDDIEIERIPELPSFVRVGKAWKRAEVTAQTIEESYFAGPGGSRTPRVKYMFGSRKDRGAPFVLIAWWPPGKAVATRARRLLMAVPAVIVSHVDEIGDSKAA